MAKLEPILSSALDAITVRISTTLAMLGIGCSKFYELMDEGEIETIKVGRSTLVLTESFRTFVEVRRHG